VNIITLVIVFTVMGQSFERREMMPNLPACWQRAPERMNEIQKAHPGITKIGVGCTIDDGEPV
jgi:hypothetical protein